MAQVWTTRQKILGNVLPGIPALAAGLWTYFALSQTTVAAALIIAAGVATFVQLVALNYLGFVGNARMRGQIAQAHGLDPSQGFFVGFAPEDYMDIWDTHKDIGFLIVQAEELVFRGDTESFVIPWSEILSVELRKNVHSAVGLGGWVWIRTAQGAFGIEPRTRPTLLASKKDRLEILRQIQKNVSPQAAVPGGS